MLRRLLVDSVGGPEVCRRKTLDALDRLEAELGGGDYLAGGAFSIADLTAAALFSPLVAPPEFGYDWPERWPPRWQELREQLAGRPGYRWVEEIYRRHRGASAEVASGS
jgi:glutathione S-transferase